MLWHGLVWYEYDLDGMACCGMAWYGIWHSVAIYGVVCYGSGLFEPSI